MVPRNYFNSSYWHAYVRGNEFAHGIVGLSVHGRRSRSHEETSGALSAHFVSFGPRNDPNVEPRRFAGVAHTAERRRRACLGDRVAPFCQSGVMRTEEVRSLVDRVTAVPVGCADSVRLKAGVEDVRRMRSWLDGRDVEFARELATVSSFPEKSLAEAANTSLLHGSKLLERAITLPDGQIMTTGPPKRSAA